MKWSSINSSSSSHADLRLAFSPPQPTSRTGICSRAFAFLLPAPVLRLLEMLSAPTHEVTPVVAWPAHALGPAVPSLVPLVLALVIVATVLGGASAFLLNLPSRAAAFPRAVPSWLKSPFKHLRTRQHHYGAELLRTYDTYKRSLDDFINMSRLCRSLQEQLKERDARLLCQRSAIDSLTYDVDGFEAQNELLRTTKDRLRSDRVQLKEQLRDEREQHAKDLLEFQRDLEGLLRQVEVLEADKAASRKKFEETIEKLQEENATLQQKVLDAEKHEACAHIPQIEDLQHRVASAQTALRRATQENDSLKHQLFDQHKAHTRQQLTQTRRHTEQQAAFVDALERFKTQLVEQQEEHARQQELLAQKVARAKADKNKIKAKLKHAREDAETKSAEAARLQTELVATERLNAAQAESFQQDLHFAYVESHFERQMYRGALSDAQTESSALRQQLADVFNRHKDQDRASHVQHTEHALKAERAVAGHLEDMLVEDLRRRNDEYETLEISFDVLESAYGFLAAELVRTEHALRDALAGRKPSVELQTFRLDPDAEDEEEDVREDDAPALERDDAAAQPRTPSVRDRDRDRDDDTGVLSVASSRDRDDTCTMSTASTSSLSERSWPATPGLVRTPDTTRAYAYTPASSPVVATPPLPALYLPRDDQCLSPSPSPFPDSPLGPDDLFDSWSEESFPMLEE